MSVKCMTDKRSHKGFFLRPTRLFLMILILLISFGVYFNALSGDFVYDDTLQIVDNPLIKDISNIPSLFFTDDWSFRTGAVTSNYYRPLRYVVFALNYYLFGLRPWGFHLVNILFHCGLAVLVFLLIKRLLPGHWQSATPSYLSPPFIAAMIFAVHPIHTEAVTWIAGLPDVSSSFFYLLSLYLYMRVDGDVGYIYLLSLASFLAAAFCKETALTLPFIVIAYDWILGARSHTPLRNYRRYIPFFAIAGLYLILRVHALKGLAPVSAHTELGVYGCVINVFPLFARYLEKLLLPVNLNAVYPFHPIFSVFEPKGFLSIAVSIAFIFLVFVAVKKNRTLGFGLLMVVVPLLPALYIPAIPFPFAERYLYLPSFGFVLVASLLVAVIANRTGGLLALALCLGVLIGGYSLGTVKRNAVWKNNYSLWTDTVKKSPELPIAHINLGSVYLKKGMIDDAIREYQTVLRFYPDYPGGHLNMGVAFFEKGLFDKAMEEFQTTLRLRPPSTPLVSPEAKLNYDTYFNMGVVYYTKGLIDEAIEQYQIALKLRPDFAQAHVNLGIAYGQSGFMDKAMEHFQTAVELDPDFASARYNLGTALLERGSTKTAIEQFRIALKIDPGYAEAHNSLGIAYTMLGRTDEAIEQYGITLKLKPEYPGAHLNLGKAFLTKERINEAISHLQAAERLNPGSEEAHRNLGDAFYREGSIDKAIGQYQIALKLRPGTADVHKCLGDAFYREGSIDKAIEQYQITSKLQPDNAVVHYNLGVVYAKKGLAEKAKVSFGTAIKLNPYEQRFRDALATLDKLESSRESRRQKR